jgi:hypothetical protein
MKFKKWLEWGSVNEIRGEYWIIDGFVDFADGDVGDRNHEGIAIDHIVSQYADDVASLAEDLVDQEVLEPGNYEVDHYGEVDYEAFETVINLIWTTLTDKMMDQLSAEQYIMESLNCDEETFYTLLNRGDPRLYVMKRMGWIAVRGNNVELFGYDAGRQKEIADAIHEIIHQEHGQEPDPSQIELSIDDHKSNKSWYLTLQELEQPQVSARPNMPITTKRFVPNPRDPEENKYTNPTPSRISPWNVAAKQAGLGSELWRGTSESVC